MDTERTPELESASDFAPAASTPLPDATASSLNSLERDVRSAKISGRFTLIAAIVAAIAAIAAAYVSTGAERDLSKYELDRSESAEAAQILRADRQKAYGDGLLALNEVVQGLIGLKAALLTTPSDHEEVRSMTSDLNGRVETASQAMTAVFLVGSRDMITLLDHPIDEFNRFKIDRLDPLVAEYFPPARPEDGVNLGTVVPDSPVLAAEISRLLPTLEPLLVDFYEQGRRDLGTG